MIKPRITAEQRKSLGARAMRIIVGHYPRMPAAERAEMAVAWVCAVEHHDGQLVAEALDRLEHGDCQRPTVDDLKGYVQAVQAEIRDAANREEARERQAANGPPAPAEVRAQVLAEIEAQLGRVTFGGGNGDN